MPAYALGLAAIWATSIWGISNSANDALGKWLGAAFGAMLLVTALYGIRNFRRGGGRWPRH